MALQHRVSTPDFLEGCSRDCVVAVLSWCDAQLAAALIKIGYSMEMKVQTTFSAFLPLQLLIHSIRIDSRTRRKAATSANRLTIADIGAVADLNTLTGTSADPPEVHRRQAG
jgi:hypothetical protein